MDLQLLYVKPGQLAAWTYTGHVSEEALKAALAPQADTYGLQGARVSFIGTKQESGQSGLVVVANPEAGWSEVALAL